MKKPIAINNNASWRPCFERWQFILSSMANNKTITAKQIADRFETSTKTIYRDIDFLRDRLNVPIVSDPSGYFLSVPFIGCPFCNCLKTP